MSSETLYRAMLPADDDKPQVGAERNMLGVRPGVDVKKEPAGPGRGGMSVTVRHPKRMPAPIRPRAFGGLNGETVMFELDEATLEPALLTLGPIDSRSFHAVVEAAQTCSLGDLQNRLRTTRPQWTPTPPAKDFA